MLINFAFLVQVPEMEYNGMTIIKKIINYQPKKV